MVVQIRVVLDESVVKCPLHLQDAILDGHMTLEFQLLVYLVETDTVVSTIGIVDVDDLRFREVCPYFSCDIGQGPVKTRIANIVDLPAYRFQRCFKSRDQRSNDVPNVDE